MTQEQMLIRLLLCSLDKLGGFLDISTELFDNLGNYQLVFDRNDEKGTISVTYKSAEIIIGSVDNGVVDVVQ